MGTSLLCLFLLKQADTSSGQRPFLKRPLLFFGSNLMRINLYKRGYITYNVAISLDIEV
jgi:hypothetical protein